MNSGSAVLCSNEMYSLVREGKNIPSSAKKKRKMGAAKKIKKKTENATVIKRE
jgi:hypothetical protein